ncbi:hypothetical protein GGF31_008197 [Allomyces arbusculus]|nr:hypothetical protein GGF31_008197 [Allomyces arbusculus]
MLDNKDNSDSDRIFQGPPSVSRNCKVTPTLVVAPAMFMFQAWTKEPMGSLDDSMRVQTKLAKMINMVVVLIEFEGEFPTDFGAHVKCTFPKVPNSTIASMLAEMLQTVLCNARSRPWAHGDRHDCTLAYVHRALDKCDHGHRSFAMTVHDLLALKLDPSCEKKLALFDDFFAALERYMEHAPRELKQV